MLRKRRKATQKSILFDSAEWYATDTLFQQKNVMNLERKLVPYLEDKGVTI